MAEVINVEKLGCTKTGTPLKYILVLSPFEVVGDVGLLKGFKT